MGKLEGTINSKDKIAKIKKDFNTLMDYLVPNLKDEPVIARAESDDLDYKKITDSIHKIIAEFSESDVKPVVRFAARSAGKS